MQQTAGWVHNLTATETAGHLGWDQSRARPVGVRGKPLL